MIPLFRMSTNDRDVDAVSKVIERNIQWAEGPEVDEFEKALINYHEVHGALVCNSGTSALHMALLACGVKHFHEVIVPSFTFIATVNAVKFLGAKPVFADIEEETFGLDPADVEKKITKNTKAIIAVHYAGHPCRIKELLYIANKHNLMLIEDVAEAQGAEFDKQIVGSFGHCAILSFCQNKIITTGEGGALLTDNKYIYDQAKLLRSHGRAEGNSFDGTAGDYISLGYNFRMSSMQAALGLSQLSRIESLIQKRESVAWSYADKLKNLKGLKLPGVHWHDARHVYQLFTIQTEKRDVLQAHLKGQGIASKVYFQPVHQTSFYKRDKWDVPNLPITEKISKQVLSLPMWPDMSEKDILTVCNAIKEVIV